MRRQRAEGLAAAGCPLHGWSFDIRSGKCTNVQGMDIETIALEVLDGEILLKLGD